MFTHRGKLLIAVLLVAAGQSATASPFTQNETKPESEQIVLPMGTALTITIMEEISSKVFFPGDAVAMEIDEDVLVNGRIVIAKGSTVKGSVTYARPGKSYGRPGELRVEAESATSVDGQEIKLRGTLGNKGKSEVSSTVALIAGFGSLGRIIARENKGRSGRIKAGAKVKAYTRQDENIAVNTRADKMKN
ncbi:MAG: hypothetical protein WBV94_07870 [Blastocatellia bacterium]